MYPALDWSFVLLAIMDISAAAVSLPDRPQRGHLGHQCSQSPGRPNLHLVFIFSQTSGVFRLDQQVDGYAACSLFASKPRPRAKTLHAIRASLLASAIARTLWCSRFLAASIQVLSP
jgi:hypothetical protein